MKPSGGFSAAILAGGESRRFGQNKALARLGGKALITHVLETLRSLFEDVLIVTNKPTAYEAFDVTVVSDIVEGAGALGGLMTALVHARGDRCFVVACDMPFLSRPVIQRMLEQGDRYDVVVPVLKGDPQPLHALYLKSCISPIQRRVEEGDFRIIDFYDKVSTLRLEETLWKDVDPEHRSFSNINTPEEFTRARKWMERWT
jgi:molybdopterin-guanine dinucleotide biosynthesis protein A